MKSEQYKPTTSIRYCGCTHHCQDAVFGPGKRVHNLANKERENGWRCTVRGDKKGA